jgi:hypothetical protein
LPISGPASILHEAWVMNFMLRRLWFATYGARRTELIFPFYFQKDQIWCNGPSKISAPENTPKLIFQDRPSYVLSNRVINNGRKISKALVHS